MRTAGPWFSERCGNLTVSQIRTVGGFVGLTAVNGAVIDGGDLSGFAGAIGTNDVQAAGLRIAAQTGIGAAGSFGALETMVSNLEAINGTGGIFIANTGSLTVGGIPQSGVQTFRQNVATPINLPSFNGVTTASGDIFLSTFGLNANFDTLATTTIQSSAGAVGITSAGDATFRGQVVALNGFVEVNAQGNFEALATATIQSSGGPVLIASAGDATFRGQVVALNGFLVVNAQGNFFLYDNPFLGALPELQTTGGQVVVAAQGNVNFINQPLVQSSTGTVLQPSPLVPPKLISAPQIDVIGNAKPHLYRGIARRNEFHGPCRLGRWNNHRDGGPQRRRAIYDFASI